MARAVSDQRRRGVRFALVWTRTTPARAALLVLVIVALVPLSLIVLRAPSWATSGRHHPSLSTQPISFRTLLVVNTLSDEATLGDGLCSLREAITTSNDAGGFTNDCGTGSGFDTIEFSVSGTITLGSELPAITQNLIIDGTGQTIAIDGAMSFQVFVVNSGAALSLNNLTVQNGRSPSTAGSGGAVNNSGALAITNSTLSNNSLGFSGPNDDAGAIFNGVGATLSATNSTFSKNFASGVGGAIASTTGAGQVTVNGCTFSQNEAQGGGAIDTLGPLMITNSAFSQNTATFVRGGAIAIEAAITASVSNSTFANNTMNGDSSFGITPSGGAITNLGSLTITNSTFFGNTAKVAFGSGGADGGAIGNEGGTATISNSTFASNTADQGAGLFNDIFLGLLPVLNLSNSIIALSNGEDCGPLKSITDLGDNIADDGSCGFAAAKAANGQTIGDHVDPMLDPNGLQKNGGPTQTIALQPGSPAIDAVLIANCPATDQRGEPRPDPEDGPNGSCDIGAFEFQDPATPTPTATASATATPSATATATASTTATSTATATATGTPTPTATVTSTVTPTATATRTATATPTATATATTTATPTSTPTPVSGKLKVSPMTLKFGDVTVNDAVTKTVTIRNVGKTTKKNHPLPILIEMEGVNQTPSPFSVNPQCSDVELMPGGKGVPKKETMCVAKVQFLPTQAVSYSGTMTIIDNLAPSEMQTVQMTGTGKPAK